jgi:multiple sugar transport system permease protein
MNFKRIIFYSVLIAVALVMLVPFFWSIYASLVRNDLDVPNFSLSIDKYGFNNYFYILTSSNVGRWYINSIIVTLVITASNLLLNSMAGYALARIRFIARTFFFLLTLGIMMVPVQIQLIPIFIMMVNLGWLDTYLALIIPFMVNPFGVFLMRQFYLQFPSELEDAARIDGLSRVGIFFRIAFPLAKPALVAQAIFIFVWNWNSFIFPSILVSSPKMFTLPVGIYQLSNTAYTASITKSMAGVVLMTIPTVLFFVIFQRYFVKGVTGAGIKG